MAPLLVFDLDDTLYSESHYVLSGFRAVDAFLRQHHALPGFFEKAASLFDKGVRGNTFNLALQALGRADTPALIQTLLEVYRSHTPTLTLFSDAQWALQHFSSQHRLALLTDGFLVSQHQKVEALGLRRFFETMVFSDEWGREFWKPHRRPFEEVMRRLQARGENCVYIADNPKKDFIAPRQLGWDTIHILRPRGEYANVETTLETSARVQIASLTELPSVLTPP